MGVSVRQFWIGVWLAALAALCAGTTAAQGDAVTDICPAVGIRPISDGFEGGGAIMTTFDRSALWLFEPQTGRRYPLPDTTPCGGNCTLSPDKRWITYFNDATNATNEMLLDGTERHMLSEYAFDVSWWDGDTLLIWTPGRAAYLRPKEGDTREYLNVQGVLSVQPGGYFGLLVTPDETGFRRSLVNLQLRDLPTVAEQPIALGADVPYYNDAAWSPDGTWLAYVGETEYDAEVGAYGAELFGVRPDSGTIEQWTQLFARYGAVRVNGVNVGDLSWSPDGTRVAFWVIELIGADPLANTGSATIHIYDVNTGALHAYCGYSTTEHTPRPPQLAWSPDGRYVAFGGNVPGDERGYLLLALDTADGIYTELSEGIYPALGTPDVIAWGLLD